jgi:glycosyltransferase involved in cell wall biosynthesis
MFFIMQESSKNSILVSIVIPVYNGERYLSYTLDSVLAQTHKNIEIIVIDDGSTDDTKDILESYSAKYPVIRTVHKTNSGVSVARNSGWEIAKGQFISFLDADDIWTPENLDLKLDFLINHPNAFGVTSQCEIMDEKNIRKGEIKKGDPNVNLEDILIWKGNYITIPSGILFKWETMKLLNGFNPDLSNNADQEILMRALKTQGSFHTLQQTTWYYRRHSDNMSSNLNLMEKDTVLTYRLAKQNKLFKSWWFERKCLSRMSLILSFSWWKNGRDMKRALKWMLISFYYSPVAFVDRILNKLFKGIRNKHYSYE